MRLRAGMVTVCAVFATGAVPTATAQPTTPPVPVAETFAGTPALMFVDEPTITNAHPMQPQAWSRTTDERVVRLHFTTGTPQCYGVSATVEETAEAVTVDLRSGTLPQAADRACIMIAVFGGLDVPLQNPLGSRRVLSVS